MFYFVKMWITSIKIFYINHCRYNFLYYVCIIKLIKNDMKNTKSKFQVWHDDNGIANIDFDYVKSSQRDNNEDRYGCDGCFICMKPIKSSNHNFWVHYTTAGTLINTIKEVEDSQGCFQIGPDCAKKLPSDFVFELLRASDWQYTPED